MPISIIFLLFFLFQLSTCKPSHHHHHYQHRRILHQPFFPLNSISPTQPPSSSPQLPQSPQQQQTPPQTTQPKYPFTSTTTPNNQPFFPTFPSPPPPPSFTTTTPSTTFPANISSLIFPQSPPHKPISPKLVAIAVILSLFSLALIVCLVLLVYYKKRRNLIVTKTPRSDNHRLFPTNIAPSDDNGRKVRQGPSSNSSEFLYLGTLVNTHVGSGGGGGVAGSGSPYRKLGSPELHPLPQLSRQNVVQRDYSDGEMGLGLGSSGEEEEEQFYSPRGSVAEKESPGGSRSNSRRVFTTVVIAENFESRSSNSSSPSYPTSISASPTHTVSNSSSPQASLSPKSSRSTRSPNVFANIPPPSHPPPPPPPRLVAPSSPPQPAKALNILDQVDNEVHTKSTLIPAPPPLPPQRYWEAPVPNGQICKPVISRPPVLITPSRPAGLQNPATVSPVELERSEEIPKPKLKPLHWDKVRASSDRAMVWDQLKSSSFQLNEEMIETLFVVNGTNLTPKENTWRPVFPMQNEENRVLDPKKSQNVAILLRALNVTVEEVCEALLEGNADTLGTELLESLLKMAPTKEEERKLRDYKDDSPFKLGPAEKFLKAVLDIPFAFKRVDAMLYISNFDSEVEYLRKSFETLEAACEELRNSRMFLKLLEAVLKTGNRMNVGTNRGDAHAFKLDTLLKLVDVKGTDGKTTLLHFVVQEITKAEGSRLSGPNSAKTQQPNFPNDVEFRKLGLQVVAGLSGDLSNVKKAAAMDSDVLSNDVSKLARGIGNVGEVLRLNETSGLKDSTRRFSESMNIFLKKAEEEIIRIQAQESVALSLVKEITEYFHGNSTKEEAHPFRIFLVVRDFLSVLDRVCKEVGKINERTIVSSARQFPVPVNPTQAPVFPILNARPQYSTSSEDESSSSS
ncbi:hypothetical protein GIB67_032863 [Kingdonia uniflora]|uniref:Formin-like protein n=1 Tax=Kingdonia uniflora TaxID=39325 RepID=A0A7J7NBV2_9MAGN|nr:hypothetical protein GIB67_032863 [Kingdonia uniflora]